MSVWSRQVFFPDKTSSSAHLPRRGAVPTPWRLPSLLHPLCRALHGCQASRPAPPGKGLAGGMIVVSHGNWQGWSRVPSSLEHVNFRPSSIARVSTLLTWPGRQDQFGWTLTRGKKKTYLTHWAKPKCMGRVSRMGRD